jgi:UDP-arabinose 4-epimerase
MNILVTGGAGYIGSHTAKTLVRNHYRPIVIDDLSTGHAHNVKWGPFVQASLNDTAVVRSVLKEHKIEAVFRRKRPARRIGNQAPGLFPE